jgi:hypothetical protein
MLPRILFPYVQQWAERSGMTLVSRLLVDEQFRALLEKYGDEVLTRVAQANQRPPPASGATSGAAYGTANGTANGHANGTANGHAAEAAGLADPPCADPRFGDQVTNGSSLSKLQERVLAMEAQETVLSILRNRMRPLALALGCCPECLVGVEGCPKCWGQSRVAYYPPDVSLLEAQVVSPLAARGVPLQLSEAHRNEPHRNESRRSGTRKSSTARRRNGSWSKK